MLIMPRIFEVRLTLGRVLTFQPVTGTLNGRYGSAQLIEGNIGREWVMRCEPSKFRAFRLGGSKSMSFLFSIQRCEYRSYEANEPRYAV